MSHVRDPKPLDINNEFKPINPIIIDYFTTAEVLTMFEENEKRKKPSTDSFDLSIRRNLKPHTKIKPEFWMDGIKNLKEILILIDQQLSPDKKLNSYLIEIKYENPEAHYKKLCTHYSRWLKNITINYIGILDGYSSDEEEPLIPNLRGSEDVIKNCITHLCFTPDIADEYLLGHILSNTTLTYQLLLTHPDLNTLNDLCSSKFLNNVLGGGYYMQRNHTNIKDDYLKIIEKIDLAQYIIRIIPKEKIFQSFECWHEYYAIDKECPSFYQNLIFYAYEKEKGTSLKIYTPEEKERMNDFIKHHVDKTDDISMLQLIFDEHYNASYTDSNTLNLIEEKILQILNTKAEEEKDLLETQNACQTILQHPILNKSPLLDKGINNLLTIINETFVQEGRTLNPSI